MILFLLDPVKQLNKAKDAQRKEDFKQIRTALDTFYNDYNCYPTSVPFGQEWKIGATTYMKKVPQDPMCTNNVGCYTYMYDTNDTCPQWNVLFGKLVIAPPPQTPACLLQSSCLPINYEALGYNLCDFGGNIDCDTLHSMSFSLPPVQNTPTSTPIPGASPTPTDTPTPNPTIPPGGFYYCGCGPSHQTICNVTFNPPINVQYYTDNTCSNQCGTPC